MPARPALPGPLGGGARPWATSTSGSNGWGSAGTGRSLPSTTLTARSCRTSPTRTWRSSGSRSVTARSCCARSPSSLGRTASRAREAEAAPRGAERRQLTVLFCDLVGSTALAARLDPEDLRDVMRAYQARCAEVIERFEGHVAKYLGDGVLAYFGWPQAHEDDAERAVRAGLAAGRGGGSARARMPGARLRARGVGIATGLVVVGDLIGEGAAQEEAVVGETPNLAARLQALAAPGSVVISQATRRLLGGVFELDDLGPQRLKGFAEPLAAWRVDGEGRAEGPLRGAPDAPALTPLVGREEELALLAAPLAPGAGTARARWCCSRASPASASRAWCATLRERLERRAAHPRCCYQCSPHHTNSPLHPVIEQLERAAGFARDDPPEARLDKLEALLARGTDRLRRGGAADRGAARRPDRRALPAARPDARSARSSDAGGAGRPARRAWPRRSRCCSPTRTCTGSTRPRRSCSASLIERMQRLPVLLVITFRPEFTPPWSGQPHVSALALTRLGRREGAALVERRGRGQAAAGRGRGADRGQDRRRAAVRRGADQDGARIGPAPGRGRPLRAGRRRCRRSRSRRRCTTR